MQLPLKALALSSAALLFAPLTHAQTAGTLTCQAADGSTIRATTYAFAIEATGYDPDATYLGIGYVYMDAASFPTLLAANAAQTVYTTCSLSNGNASLSFTSATLDGVTIEGSGAGVESTNSELYASANITFLSLSVGGVTVSTSRGTPESRAKAFAAARSQALANLKAAR